MTTSVPPALPIVCDILRAGHRPERISFEGTTIRIGSAGHCEIRVAVDQGMPEHVVVQRTPDGIMARSLHSHPPAFVNGAPLRITELQSGAVIALAGTQIRITLGAAGAAGPSPKKSSPLALLLVAAIAGGAIWTATALHARTAISEGPDAPDLWDPPVASCPSTAGEPLAYAKDRLAVAKSKRERRPFHVRDGVTAVPLYEVAAACFESAGDGSSAQLSREAARILRQDVGDEFRAHRMGLEHALRIENLPSARRETRMLLEFCGERDGEFVQNLRTLDHTLQQKVGREGSS